MRTHETESGFSLIELIVAIAVTLVVTGAVYGLLAGGQNAFRREPALTDRQQNIRLAMDILMRDLASGGEGMPAFLQTFGRFKNGAGTASTLTACTECPLGLSGEKTDELELIANPTNEDAEAVCGYLGSAKHIRTTRNQTNFGSGVVLFLWPTGEWTLREIVATHNNNGGPGNCLSGPDNEHSDLSFNSGQGTRNLNVGDLCDANSIGTSGTVANCDTVESVGNGEFVSYRIRNGADGVPNLERRSSGNVADNIDFNAASNFLPIARGVEDLQVEYARADSPNTWHSTDTSGAPQVVKDDYNSLIVKVRITLSARTTGAGKLQGQKDNASLGTAVRGSLTQTIAMRAALRSLQKQPGTGGPGQPTPLWN